MSSLVLLFIAFIAVTGSSNKVESSPAQALDLSRVLELVKQQRLNAGPSQQRKLRLRIVSSDSDSDSDDSSTDLDDSDDSEDSDNNRLVRLQKDRIVDLLETVASEKTNNDRLSYRKGKKNYGQTSDQSDDSDNKRLAKERIIDLIESVANANNKNDRITNRKGKQNYGQTSYLIRSENYDNIQSSNNNIQKQILEKLFSQPDDKQQLKPKKRLIPNRLTPTVTMDDVKKYYGNKNKNDEVTGLEDYSKVYIVLNPQAVQNSENKNSLNDLISKVLSLSSPTLNREPQNKRMPRRYKGFVVNENHPRRRFKGINDKIVHFNDDEKKLDPLVAPSSRITAMPT